MIFIAFLVRCSISYHLKNSTKIKMVRLFDSKYSDWGEKISSKLPKFNIHPDKAQLFVNMMIIIAMLGVIPVLLQCWKVYKTKESKSISVYAYIFSISLSLLWITYALLTRNAIIIVSSTLSICAALTLIFLCRKYRGNDAALALVDGSL